MAEKYNPKTAEPKWIEFWEKEGIFRFNPDQKGEVFSIDTPPPTVSGKMHLGHAFSYTQQDIIVRYKRLRGFKVFYPFGTDDNGLPTERLVEKMKKVKGARMERQAFIKLCEETLGEIRPKYLSDWKRIGQSCDFSLFYSTIDDHCRKISQKFFLDLVKKDRVYRKEAPSLWCPQCATAISQVECEDEEHSSMFNDIIFRMDGQNLVIATTRPEMLSACVAVFAHPDDNRYKKLFGKKAKVPLYDFEVPIMSDSRVDPEKGTGIVMCCTFGDQTDIEWYLAYNLLLKEAIDRTGRMTEIAGKYRGMKVADARKAIIENLKEAGLLVDQKPIEHAIRIHERCRTPIEIIQSKQWFIKYLDLKDEMLKWGEELNWYPEFMKNRYDNWIRGLQWDWLISRQRFFGIPFPVWYKKETDEPVFADESQLPVDPIIDMPTGYKKDQLIPEKDVLDTWATSSLTPQIAVDLVDEEHRSELFPMTLRPQAHDIITFWLFNTVVRSQLHHGKNPWRDVVISGFALDPKGRKMSKSKGNIIEPQDILRNYSADALRYWAASSKFGDDLAFQEKDVRTGERFVTKLWNASRFAGMHLMNFEPGNVSEAVDVWILSKLAKTIDAATEAFDKYDYAHARAAMEKFFWQDFCDNYLELVKTRLYEPENPEQKTSAQTALYTCLSSLLRIWAPFTPFVTEEVYQLMFREREKFKSVHIAEWPSPPSQADAKAEQAGDVAVAVLAAVRKKKSEKQLSMKAPVKKLVIETKVDMSGVIKDLKTTTNAKNLEIGSAQEKIAEGLKISIEF